MGAAPPSPSPPSLAAATLAVAAVALAAMLALPGAGLAYGADVSYANSTTDTVGTIIVNADGNVTGNLTASDFQVKIGSANYVELSAAPEVTGNAITLTLPSNMSSTDTVKVKYTKGQGSTANLATFGEQTVTNNILTIPFAFTYGVTADTINVSWSSPAVPAGGGSYIQHKKITDAGWSDRLFKSTALAHVISGLDAGTNYVVRLYLANSAGDRISDYKNIFVTTYSVYSSSRADTVDSVVITVTNTQLSAPPASDFQVKIGSDPYFAISATPTVSGSTITLTLPSGKAISSGDTVKVKYDRSPTSNLAVVSFTEKTVTNNVFVAPGAVTATAGSDSVDLSWTVVSGVPSGSKYYTQYKNDTANTWNDAVDKVNATSHSFTGLTASTDYDFRVWLANSAGTRIGDYGTASATVAVTNDTDFVTVWETTAAGQSVTIPVGGATGNYTVDWGDGSNSMHVTDATHSYAAAGNHTVRISGDFTRIHLGGNSTANAERLAAIQNWGNATWSTMEEAFKGASNAVYNATDAPDLSAVTNMSGMFGGASKVNGSLASWNVSGVTDMSRMFEGASAFNGSLGSWNVSGVTDMSSMFKDASVFDGNVSFWDTSGVTDMNRMFDGASVFDGNVSSWDTSGVTDMSSMFWSASAFDGNVSAWDTSGVTDMEGMFSQASAFDGDVGSWNVSGVTDMSAMFYYATSFDRPVGSWNVSGVTDMSDMFRGAVAFDRPLGSWDVSGVTDMDGMFTLANSFAQDLGNWYIVPADTAVDRAERAVANIAAQNAVLDGHSPSYGVQSGGDGNLFEVTSTGVLNYTGTLPYSKTSYSVTVTSTSTGGFGTSNSRDITVTVTGADPAYSSSKADTVGSVEVTTTAAVLGNPRAADFGVKVGGAGFAAPSGAAVSDTTITLTLPAGTAILSTDDVRVKYTRNTGHTSDLAAFTEQNVTNNVFGAPSPFTATPSSGSVALSWTAVPSAPSGAKYYVQHKLGTDTAWNAAVDKGPAVIHTFGSLTASTAYDFRVWLADATGARIGDNGTATATTTAAAVQPTHSSSRADSAGAVVVTTTGPVQGTPRAADFGVKIGADPYFAPSSVAVSGTSITLTLPAGKAISAGDAVKVKYTKVQGSSTSDLATFAAQAVTNNVADTDFVTVWKTAAAGQSVTIPVGNATGNYTADWGDGSNSTHTGDAVHTYAAAGSHTVRISGDFTRIHLGGNTTDNAERLAAIQNWGNATWSTMAGAFMGASSAVYNATDAPDLSAVTDMSGMFRGASKVDGSLASWNVSGVTDMSRMFDGAAAFNGTVGAWDVSGVTDMSRMFSGAAAFEGNLSSWNVSAVTDMSRMFFLASAFNGSVGSWDTSAVTDMSGMFSFATAFDRPVGSWNTSSVTDMSHMFDGATSFDRPVGSWDTSAVTDMSKTFYLAFAFDRPIGSWNVSAATDMDDMFTGATSFSQNLGAWYVVPGSAAVDRAERAVANVTAQNAVLDGHSPTYGVQSGGDGNLFEVTGTGVLNYTGTLPYSKASYTVTVLPTGSGLFGTSNSRDVTVTVTGVDPTYSSSKADTVDSIEITTVGAVQGIPRAADFGVQVGSSADYYTPSTAPAVSGTTITLSLPDTGLISSTDTVKVNYTKVTGSTSDLATFAPQTVTNNVFAGPGSFTPAPAPTYMLLSWAAVPSAPSGSEYRVQSKLNSTSTWGAAVDKNTARTHNFTGLSPSTDYDFRVYLVDSAGARISDHSTSFTATSNPAYSSSKADTVGSIVVTTNGSVTNTPLAADFSVQVGTTDYYSLSTAPVLSGTTITLSLPDTGLISSGAAVKVNYTKGATSTSDLANFAPQAVTNNVFAGPGSFATTPAPTYMLLSWAAVPSAPSGSEYRVQSKLNSTSTWGAAVDKNTARTHNFTGLSPSTDYDFRVYLVDSAGARISDHSTSFTATSNPAYSSSKADTVGSIVVTTNGSVTNTPLAADFSVQVGTADYYSLSTAPVLSGTTITLSLPDTGLISSGAAVKVNYTKGATSTSDLANFAPQAVTNNVFAGPGSFTTTAAPTSMALSWSAVSNPPANSKYFVQHKLNSTGTWNTPVDKGTSGTSHTFTGLTASTDYDFRVWLEDSAGARISDYSTSFTATAAPAYSSSKADTVDSIVLTTNGSVTGTPRAADFSVQVGTADYYSLSTPPAVSGTTITLSLPSTGLISNGDAVKVNYTKVTGSTSDLATFAPQAVTNNVFAGPGSFATTPAPTYMLLSWAAVPSAPSGSEYRVQSKLNSTSTWGAAVDKNTARTHNFTGLSPSTDYDFRVYLVDSAGARISDYSTSFTATSNPAYSSSKADTVGSIVVTTNGSVTNTPLAADFSVQVGTTDYYSLSTAPVLSGTTITLSLPDTGLISSGAAVKVNYTKGATSTSDLANFAPQAVTNNVFAGPGSFTTTAAPTSMALSWSAVPSAPSGSKYYVQHKLNSTGTWNTPVDKGTSGTSHTFTGLTASTDYDFRVYLVNSAGARISDYSTSFTATAAPAYSSSKADTVDSIEITTTGSVTGTPRAADFGVQVGASADYYSLSTPPAVSGTTITLSLPSTGLISNGDAVKVNYTKVTGSTSDLATFAPQAVTNNVFVGPGSFTATPAPTSMALSWSEVSNAPSGSKYFVQHKLDTDTTWNTAVDKGASGTSHTFTGLTASTEYDFRVWLEDSAGDRISDYSTSDTATSNPAYSSSKADTVDSIEVTVTGNVTGTPRAADFEVKVGSAAYYPLSATPSIANGSTGSTVTLTLPSTGLISYNDAVKVKYTRNGGYTSDLAAFAGQAVTNNVFAAPGGGSTTPTPVTMSFTWTTVQDAPSGSKYYVQYKLGTDTDWNAAVDKGTSGTNHTFTGLTAATSYDFRAYLADASGTRISDYRATTASTSVPEYSSSRADTVGTVTVTTVGITNRAPYVPNFGVQIGSSGLFAPASLSHSGTEIVLTLPSGRVISSDDTVQVQFVKGRIQISNLANFAAKQVTNNVFAGPGSFTATAAPTSMALTWSAVPNATSGSKYYVQHKLDSSETWNTAVDKGASGTSHTFTGLTASTEYDFRVWLANAAGARIGDYSTSDTATSNPAYSSSKADTVDSIELTVTGNVTGTPRAADFEVKVGAAAYYPLSTAPSVVSGSTGSTVTLSLPSTGLISNGDAVKVKYTRNTGYASDLAAFTEQDVTNNVFAGPGSFTATPAPTFMLLSWTAVSDAPSGSKYFVQYKLDTANTWNTAVDKGASGLSHNFTGLTASTEYDFRVWLANSGNARISDHSTSDTATAAPAYSSSKADTVDSIVVTTNGSVTGTPRAADFSVQVGTADYYSLSTAPVVSNTTVTLSLPSTGLISSGAAVKVNYTKVTGSTSDLATFAPQAVTNNVFAGPGSFTATAAPTSMALTWSAVPNATSGSKYYVQHKLNASETWNTAVDKGASGTSHTFTGLTASTEYDFRVWLANAAGARIGDYSTSDTATSNPAYSSSAAVAVSAINVTTVGSVTGTPRAADFEVRIGTAAYFALSDAPSVDGDTVALTLPSGKIIGHGDAVKVKYTRNAGYTSDLAAFTEQTVTNNVLVAPSGIDTVSTHSSMAVSWDAVIGAPQGSKYFVQHKLNASETWNDAVDKGTARSHTFTGLVASTVYDFRVWLADSGNTRITDYGNVTAATIPTYSAARADTANTVTLTATGAIFGLPRAQDFGVTIGQSSQPAVPTAIASVNNTATATLTLSEADSIPSGATVTIRHTSVAESTSDLATFPPRPVTNNVFAAPGGIATSPTATSMAVSWNPVPGAPQGSKYLVQHKLGTDSAWGAAVDRGSGTSHTFTGLAPSAIQDFRAYLADSAGARIGDYALASRSTDAVSLPSQPPPPPATAPPAAPAYSSASADTVRTVTVTTTAPVTGVPRAADFGIGISGAPGVAPVGPPAVSGTAIALTLPADTAMSSSDAVTVAYTKSAQSRSNLEAFAASPVTNNVLAAPGGVAAAPSPPAQAPATVVSWNAVPGAPSGSKYLVQYKPAADASWNTAVDKGAGTSHAFAGLSAPGAYDFRVYVADAAGARISDYGTARTAGAPAAYAGAAADTVDTVRVTTSPAVAGVPRAADFGISVGGAPGVAPAGAPAVNGTAITLPLPANTTISSTDTVRLSYAQNPGYTSNLAPFTDRDVANNVLPAPGNVTAAAAAAGTPASVTLSWSPAPSAPPGSKYHVQYKPSAGAAWDSPAVDRGAAATSHVFAGLSASAGYDFRVYLANAAGARISDYGTATTAATVAYSSAAADTAGTVTLVTNATLSGVPRAADFGIGIGGAPGVAPASAALAPASAANGTAITLSLPADTAISSTDTVRLSYAQNPGYTSNLAPFTGRDVANNVLPAPGNVAAASPLPTTVTLSWSPVPSAPPGSKYHVQHKQGAGTDWDSPAVDRGAAGLTHTFGSLSPSTQYDFRVWLADAAGARISDYGTASNSTAPLQPPSAGATVAGKAFEDADRDGLPGAAAAEPGLPGITVLVYDYILGVPHRVQTGADGGYAVTNVTLGQTALSQIVLPLPAGYLPTGGIFDLVAYTTLLTAAAPAATVDFPLYRVPASDLGTVTFDVFDDADGDGERDAGEPGVPGATVFTFELLTFEADVQSTGDSGSTTHPNLIPDVVLAQISYSDPSTGELLLPDGFTRITTANGGAEYLTIGPGATHTVRIGLGR